MTAGAAPEPGAIPVATAPAAGAGAPVADAVAPGPRVRLFLTAAFLAPLLGWIPLLLLLALAIGGRRSLPGAIAAVRADAGARIVFALAALHALVVIAADVAHGPAAQGARSLRVLLPLCLPFVGFALLRRGAIDVARLSRWAAWAVAAAFAVLLLEWCVLRFALEVVDGRARALSANSLFVSAMLVPMVLLAWLDPGRSEPRFVATRLAATVLGLVCVAVFTASRASMLILLGMLPAVIWYLKCTGRLDRRAAIAAALGLLVALPLLAALAIGHSDAMLARFRALHLFLASGGADLSDDLAIRQRWTHWQAAWAAFAAAPWSGYGFANEARAIAAHLVAGVELQSSAHQQYLSFALGAGLAGLAAGLALLAVPLAGALRAAPRSPHAVWGACCVLVPFALNGLTDTLFDDLRIQAYYLILSLLLVAALGGRASSTGPVQPAAPARGST